MIDMQNIYAFPGWEDAKGYPPGLKIKTLRDEQGVKTVLFRVPSGYNLDGHKHDYYEQQLILQGELQCGKQTFSAGSYISLSPQKNHGPYYCKNGALLLVIWDHMKS